MTINQRQPMFKRLTRSMLSKKILTFLRRATKQEQCEGMDRVALDFLLDRLV
jgi:hypothetical protein